ncbi:MAG: ribosome maturation factor [Fusobacteriia bacterium 4572_132]|nr:MAG: ribosome maturation factor [Fusobacteriia bacterium 4572_132]
MESEGIVKKIEKFVSEKAENMALELVDVEYMQDGAYWYVRIYVDKEGGVGLDDCKMLSKKIEDEVDKMIKREFFLEVSSPGLERPLKKEKDFIRFQGEKVNILLKNRIDGARRHEGIMEKYENKKIYLKCDDDKLCEIPYEEVKKAKLVFEF